MQAHKILKNCGLSTIHLTLKIGTLENFWLAYTVLQLYCKPSQNNRAN